MSKILDIISCRIDPFLLFYRIISDSFIFPWSWHSICFNFYWLSLKINPRTTCFGGVQIAIWHERKLNQHRMKGHFLMAITEKISFFIHGFDLKAISEEALFQTRSAIMDYVGVTLAGLCEESAAIVRKVVKGMGGHPQATMWGEDGKASVLLAALANGTAAHALDLDDTNPVMMSHPSIQLLPGLFAIGEGRHSTGEEVMMAYIISSGCRIWGTLFPPSTWTCCIPETSNKGQYGLTIQTTHSDGCPGAGRRRSRTAGLHRSAQEGGGGVCRIDFQGGIQH